MSYGSGVTQCPHCGAIGTYEIRMQQGGQVVNCQSCRRNFTAEVKNGQFTGRSR